MTKLYENGSDCFWSWCRENNYDPVELSKNYGFPIRPRPKEQWELSQEEWEALRFNPYGGDIYAAVQGLSREQTRAKGIEAIPNVLIRAAGARNRRLKGNADQRAGQKDPKADLSRFFIGNKQPKETA